MLSALVAAASVAVAIPTTKVGNPAVLAAATAFSAPTASVMLTFPPAQLGSPSVARRRYFGLGSVSPCRYWTALFITAVVGVPIIPVNCTPLNAAWISCALAPGVMSTAGAVAAPQTVASSPRKMSPQFTVFCVCPTTRLSAAVTCVHFEVAPQLPSPAAVPPAQG